jgi:hypothetical protein
MTHPLLSLTKSYLEDPVHWPLNISWRIPRTISELDIVFVIGAPLSGTTLLQRILASHSLFFSIEGETGLFSYQNIFASKRKHFGLYGQEIFHLFKDSKDIVDFFDKGIRTLSEKNGNRKFIEKTPQHITRLPFLLKHFPNAKFLHVVRDGRDCFCSAKGHPHIPQNKSVKRFAKYWKKCVVCPIKVKSVGKMLTLRYEDFCSKPKEQLQMIMDFLGYPLQDIQLDPEIYSKDHRANLDHFKRLRSQITPASVGRWKEEMNKFEKQTFVRIAIKELNFYGYK